MIKTFAEKIKGLSLIKVFTVLSGLITILFLVGLIIAIGAMTGDSSGGSQFFVFIKTFLNAIYTPSFVLLVLIFSGLLLYGVIAMIGETASDAPRMGILLIVVFILGVAAMVKTLVQYRPEPTTAYLIAFSLVLLLLLGFTLGINAASTQISKQEKRKRAVILIPFVVLADYFVISLIFAMIHFVKYGVVEVGYEKLCSGILVPVAALACLFMPILVLLLMQDDDPRPAAQEETSIQNTTPE